MRVASGEWRARHLASGRCQDSREAAAACSCGWQPAGTRPRNCGRRYAAFGVLGGLVLGLPPEAMLGRRYAANHSVALKFDDKQLDHNELNVNELNHNELNANELRGIHDVIAVSMWIEHPADVVCQAKEVLVTKRVVADIRR